MNFVQLGPDNVSVHIKDCSIKIMLVINEKNIAGRNGKLIKFVDVEDYHHFPLFKNFDYDNFSTLKVD